MSLFRCSLLLLCSSFCMLLVAKETALKICSNTKMQQILSPASQTDWQVLVDCKPTFKGDDIISKRLIFQGAAASHLTVDCQGATLNGGPNTLLAGKDIVEIRSKIIENEQNISVEPISHFHLTNCKVNGSIRIYGLGKNGQAKRVKQSSLVDAQHDQRTQQAAPSNITLSHLNIHADYRIPVYFAPGVQYSRLSHSQVSGESISTLVYLDAESGFNKIEHNQFTARSLKREVIAIDGSEHNTISHNHFYALRHGGIFLYRNCGEGGTVRITTPSHNLISHNYFYRNSKDEQPVIDVGAREGWRWYCFDDRGYDYGSSLSNHDFAFDNHILHNQFYPNHIDAIEMSRFSRGRTLIRPND